jgi:hypothetical protein
MPEMFDSSDKNRSVIFKIECLLIADRIGYLYLDLIKYLLKH